MLKLLKYPNGFLWGTATASYQIEGACEEDGKVYDFDRINFLKSYLSAAHKLFKDNINLKGYFLWSLMDNFEWSFGYTQRFGIIYTDYATLKRIPKQSAYFYKNIIKQNGIKV